MKSYFFCLFGAALLSGVVSMAAEGSGFEKHIRYVCALVCTIAVIAPLAKADLSAIELPVVAETEVSGGEGTVVDIAEQNAKEYISSLLMKKFGISCTDVRIELDSDGDSVTVTGVCVTIDGGDAVTIKRWLDETLGGNVEVIYDRAV